MASTHGGDSSARDSSAKNAIYETSYHDINKVDSSICPVGSIHDVARVIDHKAERALCRKFDIRLMPVLALMYLFNALDKGNLSNAETDGLSKGKPKKP